ncbi:MAG: Metalloendopeptidase [Firmicutes bacterium]|nr:Metalloendopeptidase [Bacillota bacterium]
MTKLQSLEKSEGTSGRRRPGTLTRVLRTAPPLHSALAFLASSISVGFFTVLLVLYTPCYNLTVDGAPVGRVSSRDAAELVTTQVEGQVSQLLGRTYTLDLDLAYDFTIAPKESLMTHTHLADSLMATIPEVKQAYVLSVDGVELGAAEQKPLLDQVLLNLQEQYNTENTHETFFTSETRITRKYIDAEDTFLKEDAFRAALVQDTRVQSAYEVQEGDSLASLAESFGMTQQEFLAINPNLDTRGGLLTGQMVNVEKTAPLLSVGTVDRISYTREIPSPVQEVRDPSMYEGDRRVITQGQTGQEQIYSDVTSVNGQVQYEEIRSRMVLSKPTETVMAVGTMERPTYYSTGSLQWPTTGDITSPFGYRYIFGRSSFHSAIDIANSYGTPIYAADSGVVTKAEYSGTFGNLIVIDHGNGMETYYAHSATMDVSVGDGVKKGQLIATMGSTGRATGKHCHFEVHINGEAVNPEQYLP